MKADSSANTKVGVNYKAHLREELLSHASAIDILEVTTEKLFIKGDDPILHSLIDQLPISLHGLDMSLGSSGSLNADYLKKLSAVLTQHPHEWFSDHLSLTAEGGVEVGHLMPMLLSEQTLTNMIEKVRAVRQLSPQPFLIENITYYYPIPGSDIPEAAFLAEIANQTDSGLLLDINNLYINAVNHGFDPDDYLRTLPLDRVIEIHLAGGSRKFGMLIDTHATDVWQDVWDLFDRVCEWTRPQAVIIERDANFGPFSQTLAELNTARRILAKRGHCRLPGKVFAMTTAA
jgi:uncharacterized protein (UPF0276 family)